MFDTCARMGRPGAQWGVTLFDGRPLHRQYQVGDYVMLKLDHIQLPVLARKARERREAIRNVANALGEAVQTNDNDT